MWRKHIWFVIVQHFASNNIVHFPYFYYQWKKVSFFELQSSSGGIVKTVQPHDFRIESSLLFNLSWLLKPFVRKSVDDREKCHDDVLARLHELIIHNFNLFYQNSSFETLNKQLQNHRIQWNSAIDEKYRHGDVASNRVVTSQYQSDDVMSRHDVRDFWYIVK